MSIPFNPVYGAESTIQELSRRQGYLYFTTDSGKILLDTENENGEVERIVLGANGAAVFYSNASGLTVNADDSYTIFQRDLDDQYAIPKQNDLIINTDGRFFRVNYFSSIEPNPYVSCTLIAVSGTGGGGSSDGSDPSAPTDPKTISVEYDSFKYSFLAGTNFKIGFTAISQVDVDLNVSYTIINIAGKTVDQGAKTIKSGEKTFLENLGRNISADGSAHKINIKITGANSRDYTKSFTQVRCVNLKLAHDTEAFSNAQIFSGETFAYYIKVYGQIQKLLYLKVDGKDIEGSPFSLSSSVHNKSESYTINNVDLGLSAGVHEIVAYLEADGVTSNVIKTDFIYHPSTAENNTYIIITDYPEQCLSYETPTVKYWVYDTSKPEQASNQITFSVNGVEVDSASRNQVSNKLLDWEIIGLIPNQNNKCEISCGESSSKSFSIYCEKSDIFDEIDTADTVVLLNAEGRTNDTTLEKREKWSYTKNNKTVNAKLLNFSWGENNGWLKDSSDRTCLRISNGASVEIPLNLFTSSQPSQGGYTFDFEFKPYNLYSYKLLTQSTTTSGEDENVQVDRQFDISQASITYSVGEASNAYGLGCGTQDAFFKLSNGDHVTARYTNDKIINLTITVDAAKKLLYMYVNGVMSGITKYDASSANFPVQLDSNSDIKLIFNSNHCDIDLYNVRVYRSVLSSKEVVQNYIASKKDLIIAKQNQLATGDEVDYLKIVEYNAENPDNPTIPYIIFKTKSSPHVLPFNKNNDDVKCDITFVNPALDIAFSKEEISEEEYKLHAPSFFAVDVPLNVQGTSSQKYPRKNFKGKFKKPIENNNFNCTHELIKDKKLEKFSIRPGIAEKTFTWKADYMDSSSCHNTGFASYVYELYNKHPLDYYESNQNYHLRYRTSLFGFPVLAFHEKAAGEVEFIGIYNFNLDKGADTTLGMDLEKQHPYINGTFEDEDNNGNIVNKPLDYAHICECWEMANNKGGRCSFRGNSFDNGFEFNSTGDSVTGGMSDLGEDLEVRYHINGDAIEGAWENRTLPSDDPDSEPISAQEAFNVLLGGNSEGENRTGAYKNLEVLFKWLESCYYAFDLTNDVDLRWIKPLAKYKYDNFTTDERQALVNLYETYNSEKILLDNMVEDNMVKDSITLDIFTNQLNKTNDLAEKIIAIAGLFKNKNEYNLIRVQKIYTETTDTKQETKVKGFDIKKINISKEQYSEIINQLFTYYSNTETQNQIFSRYGELYRENGDPVDYFCKMVEDERRVKFESEFNKHLNMEYCMIYYIMTELLLQFDSRGKNMMLASWGPIETGGDYVWFPIFYDIDTQLGVNNSGIPSWEYNIEPSTGFNTNDGKPAFSTPNSLLWRNFHRSFVELQPNEIRSAYRNLRGGKLQISEINKYYNFNGRGSTDSDYCLKGILPINIFNTNQYYKYIQPSIDGYVSGINTDGSVAMTKTDSYFYCLQGTRELHRDLFLRNRFNYYDSKWMAGAYQPGKSNEDFWRINSNALESTNPLKNSPVLTIVPALDQYIVVWPDDDTTTPIFAHGGQKITIDLSSQLPDKDSYTQQIIRVGGMSEFIQEFGNVSLLYPDEFIYSGSNFTKIEMGNDNVNYVPNTNFALGKLSQSLQGKSLLKVFDITNIDGTGSSTPTVENVNLTESMKLEEFKALGTELKVATFADGVNLQKVYLPNTITEIKLNKAMALTDILENPTIIDGLTNPTQNGLYIKDLFKEGVECNISKIDIKSGGLGQNSYKLLNQITMKRNSLAINMEDVQWSPYVQIGEGAEQEEKPYYYADDNNTFIEYSSTLGDWYKLVLSGRIYEKVGDPLIEDLSLLNIYKNDTNHDKYTNIYTSVGTKSGPTISGSMFINNTNAISEYDLFTIYKTAFPNLDIKVANIAECYRARFVYEKDGVETEIYTFKGEKDKTTNIILSSEAIKPQIPHETFSHWSLDKEGTQKVEEKIVNGIKVYEFGSLSANRQHVTFYAIYKTTAHTIKFEDVTSSETEPYSQIIYIDFDDPIELPTEIPTRPEEEAQRFAGDIENKIPEPYRIDFRGWTTEASQCKVYETAIEADQYVKTDIGNIKIDKDYNFYPIYAKISAFLAPADVSGFEFSDYGSNELAVSVRSGAGFNGRITIPASYNGKKVVRLQNFSNLENVDYIFFEQDSEIREVASNCFNRNTTNNPCCAITGIFFPGDTLQKIESYAFASQDFLYHISDQVFKKDGEDNPIIGYISQKITSIEKDAFNMTGNQRGELRLKILPAALTSLGTNAFTRSGANVIFADIPKGLLSIPSHAFSYCGTRVSEIPANITSIGSYAFSKVAERDNLDPDLAKITTITTYYPDCTIDTLAFSYHGAPGVKLNYYSNKTWTNDQLVQFAGQIGVSGVDIQTVSIG